MSSERLFELRVSNDIRKNIKEIIKLEKQGISLTEEHLFIFHCICNNTRLVEKNKNQFSELTLNKAIKYAIKNNSYDVIELLLDTGKINTIPEDALKNEKILNMFIDKNINDSEKDLYEFFLADSDKIINFLRKRMKPSEKIERELIEYDEFLEFFPELAIKYIDENSNLINKLNSLSSRLLMEKAIKDNNELLLDKLLRRGKGLNLLIDKKSILDNAGNFLRKLAFSDIDIKLVVKKFYNTDDVEEAKILLPRITIDDDFIAYSDLAVDPIRELMKKKMGETDY